MKKRFTAWMLLTGLALAPWIVAAQGFQVPAWSVHRPAVFPPAGAAVRVQADAAGNAYVAATVVNPGLGDPDVVLYKFGCDGAFQWLRTYDHAAAGQPDWLGGLALDSGGNIYVALTATAGAGGGDWVALKYDASGALLWRTNHGSPAFDRVAGVAVDARGTVALAGEFNGGAQVRAIKLDGLSGAVVGPFGFSPTNLPPASVKAMQLDGDGNVWVVGSADSRCLTLRFGAAGRGLVFSGSALSPEVWGPAGGQDVAWSAAGDRVFVLAGVAGSGLPAQQGVLCYWNVAANHLPLATNWNPAGPLPGTDLKPLAALLVNVSAEFPVAIQTAPGGGIVTLAGTTTQFGSNWLVAAWNPAGTLFAEADSDLGPGGSRAMFDALEPAALAVDASGRAFVSGTGSDLFAGNSDFATVQYSPGLGQEAFNVFDLAGAKDFADALALDVAGSVLVAGASDGTNGQALSTLKLSPGGVRNDACTTARVIGPGTVAFSSYWATNSVPAVGACGASRQDVWFRWTAPASGTVELDTLGSCFDTVLAVYTGNCGALTPVPGACNDNALAGRPVGTAQSFVSFVAAAGTTYFIQVGGGNLEPSSGDGRLTLFGPLPLPGTCPPSDAPPGVWRKLVVLGSGNGDGAGLWRLTVPGCTDVLGQAPTALGDSPATLAAKLAASINAACGQSRVRAVAVGRSVLLHVIGCPPGQPMWFRIGPAGTPPDQLCLVPDVGADGVAEPGTPAVCSYNPQIAAVQVGPDCNSNGIPDEVDIASGSSQDTNTNGVPDECEGGLRIRPQAAETVLFWGVPNYFLETSPSLSTPNWQKLIGGSPIVIPTTNSESYFRLQQWP